MTRKINNPKKTKKQLRKEMYLAMRDAKKRFKKAIKEEDPGEFLKVLFENFLGGDDDLKVQYTREEWEREKK